MLPSGSMSTTRQRFCFVSYVSMSILWLVPERLTPRSQRAPVTRDHVVTYVVVLPFDTELQFQVPDVLATRRSSGSVARGGVAESIGSINTASIETGCRAGIVSPLG